MTTNIRAWGNSQGIYIPKKLLTEAAMNVNDSVEISVVDGAIMIRKDNASDTRRELWASLKAIRDAHIDDESVNGRDHRKEYEEYLDEKYGF